MSESENAVPISGENGNPGAEGGPRSVKTYFSDELFLGAKEIWIRHGEETYRLPVTRNGRWILTK